MFEHVFPKDMIPSSKSVLHEGEKHRKTPPRSLIGKTDIAPEIKGILATPPQSYQALLRAY